MVLCVHMPDLLLTFPFMLASILHMVYAPSSSTPPCPSNDGVGLELVPFHRISKDAPTTMATGLLRRMTDFHEAEDKLQCLLMALVLLSYSNPDADSLLPALERAVQYVDRARLLQDIQRMEVEWPYSTCGAEAYALTMLCAATSSSENVAED